MIEVEIKLQVNHQTGIEEKLHRMGFCKGKIIREIDRYFDSEIRPIRINDEALRIRQVIPMQENAEGILIEDTTGDERNYGRSLITFKGKKLDQISMTRKELETSVGDVEIVKEMFHVLGFYETKPVVDKIRKEYHKNVDKSTKINACVDNVRNLGEFLELEIVIDESDGENGKEKALGIIEETLEEIGYSMKDTTRTSYLSMLQE